MLRRRVESQARWKLSAADEGVAAPLLTEGRHGAMTGDETHGVAEWKEPVTDRVEKLAMVAARKVGAPDRAAKEHVADLGQLRFGLMEDDVSGCVSGAMDDFQALIADRDPITVLEPAIRLEDRDRREAEHSALLG